MTRAELQTARLTLRPPCDDDAGWIAAEIARPAVHSRLTAPPRPYGLADAVAWLGLAKGRAGQYVIAADQPIGVVTLDPLTRGSELGYWLRQSAWGHGYMTEAVRAVVAEHFADGASELVSGHLTGNVASARVLGKLGFRHRGTAKHKSGFYGCEVEVQRMALARDAFVAALPVEARSARLTYRSMQATDVGKLHALHSDWSVVRQLGS